MTVTERPVTLKTGGVIPAGTEVVSWCPGGHVTLCQLATGHAVRIRSAFHVPSMKELHAAIEESRCLSITEHVVEPDGFSPDGAPSWCQAVGIM